MDPSDDVTAVVQMRQGLDSFLSRPSRSTNFSINATTGSSNKLNFDASGLLDDSTVSLQSQSISKVSMQRLVEKEKEDRMKQAELVKAKALITKLENEKTVLEMSRKRARIEYERDIDNLKQEQQSESEKISQLRHQLHMLATREEEAQTELTENRKEMENMKINYEQKLSAMQREKLKMEEQLADVEGASRGKILELKNETMRLRTELQICKSELDETKEQLTGAKRRIVESKQSLLDLEEQKQKTLDAEVKVKELQRQLDMVEEDAVVNKVMRDKLTKMPELEAENRRLKEENMYCKDTQENTYLLKEEVASLRSKLERTEQRMSDYEKMKVECQELRTKLKNWESTDLVNQKKPLDPTELQSRMADLQNQNMMLLEKQGVLQASSHSLEQQLRSSEQKVASLKSKCDHLQQNTTMAQSMIKRIQRKLLLVTKERDGFKSILDSYESEATINVNATMSSRVQHLESLVESYQKQVASLEADIEMMSRGYENLQARSEQLQTEVLQTDSQAIIQPATSEVDQKIITELRENIAELEKKVEALVEEKDILQTRLDHRMDQGDYDPSKTRVFHLRMNPAALAQKRRAEELEMLKKENERLTQRVQVLEEGGGEVANVTMKVEEKLQEPSTSKEIEEMKTQLTSAELKNKRLMEAFKKTSQEFREVCYQLLGYRIDIPCTNQYKLMNMYADSPEDFLLFQQSSDGEIQLLGNTYSARFLEKAEMYLENAHSIPAFLSSITMDLFSHQTIME